MDLGSDRSDQWQIFTDMKLYSVLNKKGNQDQHWERTNL